jgi:hypothetical protein
MKLFDLASTPQKQTETISDSLEQRTELAPPAVSAKPEFKVSKVLATPAVRKLAMDYKVFK